MNERLRRMDDERMAALETKVNLWMESTTDYRKALCGKLDKVLDKLSALPCEARCERSKFVDIQLKSLWGIVAFVTLWLLSFSVLWGQTQKQVEVNTERWNRVISKVSGQADAGKM